METYGKGIISLVGRGGGVDLLGFLGDSVTNGGAYMVLCLVKCNVKVATNEFGFKWSL